MFPISLLFKRLITTGTLIIVDPRGRRETFGTGRAPVVALKVHRRWLAWRFILRPAMTAGEGFMDGEITVEDGGDILDFLSLVALNQGRADETSKRKVWDGGFAQRIRNLNFRRRAKRNVAHHYEFGAAFYDLFLDKNRQYSCAYFRSDDDTLDQAQINKLDHVARKLMLNSQHRVLDIGSGWGGLARHMNAVSGAHVTGITLAEDQAATAQQMARDDGKADALDFRIEDYRSIEGTYDRIVSVGMFEHVGPPHYRTYFRWIHELLADGVAMVHTIGRTDGPGGTNAWSAKYIFPGGYSPALSEVLPAIEKSGLIITDIESLRLHYAKTTLHWLRRLQANRDAVVAMYDERLYRMFEFFLAGCVGAFKDGGLVVYQIQLSKQLDAVPSTRDYLYE